MVLDDRLSFNEYHSQSGDDATVRDGVPWEAETEHVDEDSEEHDGQIVDYLKDGASQDVGLYLLLQLLRRAHARVKVEHHSEEHEHEAQEYYHYAMPDVLRYVKVEVHVMLT